MTLEQFKENYKILLNEQQEMAVQSVEGANLLLAVPGSGKTTVLVARLGYMILCKGIAPENILAITYTKAATEDMKRRFADKFGRSIADKIQFRTINGISDIIVKRYSQQKGTTPFDLISDRNISVSVIKNIIKKYLEDYPTENDIKEIEILIAYIKNMMLSENEISELSEELPILSIYKEYQEILVNRHLMDYDDQLVYALKILNGNSGIRSALQARYKYICVDEAQDTSKLQHAIIKILVGDNNNIFMVGDEDQSIYGFRAAYPQALIDFKKDYVNPNVLYMEKNYRSTVEIIEKADNFIQKNQGRYDKKIISTREHGECVFQEDVSTREEQYKRLFEIAKTVKNETAFLYRDNDSAIPLVDAFLRENIPFCAKKVNGSFFTNKIVSDVKDFLRFAINPRNSKAFMNIYYKCGFGFNKQTVEWACQRAERENITIPQALIIQLGQWDKLKKRAQQFKSFIDEMRNETTHQALSTLYEYYSSYIKDKNLDYGKYELLKILSLQEESIKGFLNRIEELQSLFKTDETLGENGVNLSTIHSSKGLEYDTVYLMDVYDGIFPSVSYDKAQESIDDMAKYQEERRLFYVGMTRAKNHLKIFSIKYKKTSFVDEIFASKKVLVIPNEKSFVRIKTREELEQERIQEEKSRNVRIKNRARGYEEVKDLFTQQHSRIIDSFGCRWVKCEKCGEIQPESEFSTYGGADHVNLGTCRLCSKIKR